MTYLILENGTILKGKGFGKKAPNVDQLDENAPVGEIVFNTSMIGYQEILTDPSYNGQLVTMTYPHIGNYGVEDIAEENSFNNKIPCSALVVKEYYEGPLPQGKQNLDSYLKKYNKVGISDIDTRYLVSQIRTKGSCKALIFSSDDLGKDDKEKAVAFLDSFPFISDRDLISSVSTKKIIENPKTRVDSPINSDVHFALIDFGVKQSIIEELYKRGATVTLFPHTATKEDIENSSCNAIFLSNGPGDPMRLPKAVELIKYFIEKLPICGICLGHQLITLALGGETEKMKFGHHGGNQPVKDLFTSKTFVTSQNHGYMTKKGSLSSDVKIWFENANDKTVEGLKVETKKIMSVQFHPEAAPGPRDSYWIFDEFIKGVK